MKGKIALAVFAFVVGVLGTLVVTDMCHPGVAHAGLTVDPLYIVHQTAPGGPISVYSTSSQCVVDAVADTPDNGTSADGKTTYIVGTPYLTTATQALENKLYIGHP